MGLTELHLTLNPNTTGAKRYIIKEIQETPFSTSKESISISIPGTPPRENILFGLAGMESSISVDFYIHNDGTDKSDGTHSPPVITLDEQMYYLSEVIHSAELTASWEIHAPDFSHTLQHVPCHVENIDIVPISLDFYKWKPARVDLIVGEGIF